MTLDIVSILPSTLKFTVGKYRRSNPIDTVRTLLDDIDVTRWRSGCPRRAVRGRATARIGN